MQDKKTTIECFKIRLINTRRVAFLDAFAHKHSSPQGRYSSLTQPQSVCD